MRKFVPIAGLLLLIEAAAFPANGWAGGRHPRRQPPKPPVWVPPQPPPPVAQPPAPPVVGQPPAPAPQPAPAQPWLVRAKGHSGSYILTPDGEVVKE